jgi:hypothetical protein
MSTLFKPTDIPDDIKASDMIECPRCGNNQQLIILKNGIGLTADGTRGFWVWQQNEKEYLLECRRCYATNIKYKLGE